MKDAAVWWRTGAGVIAWSVLALASAATAWAAVDVVRDNTTGPIPLAISSASPSPSPSAKPPRRASPTPTESAQSGSASRTIRSPGGTLAVACSGRTARLVYATPAAGWRMEPDETSGERIRVAFVRGATTYELSGHCRDGVVEAEVEETSSGD